MRVQHLIAARANLKPVAWDGYMKHYMPPPPLPNKRDKDWIYSSVFYAAMDDENDVFPDKLENLISILCEVIYSYCILF